MKKASWLLLLLLLTACATRPPAKPVEVDAATLAQIERIEGLIVQQPSNVAFIYVLATFYDRAHDAKNVVRLLTRLDELGFDLGLGLHSFPNTSSAPAFRRIAAKLEARETRANRAVTAWTFPAERNVRSEGIAYDPVDDVFYFSGGAAKLLRVDRGGNITEIAVEPPGEKFGRLGMDVVADRRQIWVVNAGENGESAVSVYDLRDGRLLRRVMRGSREEPSYLNDLTILKDGTAFVTDTGRNEVVRLAPDADTFELWASDFRGPNGIAVSADESVLYVADFRGLNRFELATKARQLLETSTPLNGIDGLTEHRGALIGIQNVLGRPRVVRVHVKDGNRVELLESKNPLLDVPATGVVARDEYFFFANLGKQPATILRIPL